MFTGRVSYTLDLGETLSSRIAQGSWISKDKLVIPHLTARRDANTAELGKLITSQIAPTLEGYGLSIPELYIENISLPPAVEKALDKRTSMGIVGDLDAYTRYSAAEAMTSAAENPAGGGMAAGLGAGMGMAMGQQMAQPLRARGHSVDHMPAPWRGTGRTAGR